MPVFPISPLRRRLLTAAASASALIWPFGYQRTQAQVNSGSGGVTTGPLFFSKTEYDFINAACARLIPDGEEGTGALAAAVPFFIDRQLAGPYGQGERRYSDAPWQQGTPEQGYQLAYTPAQLYRVAIADINAHCQASYQRVFAELSPTEQDALLHQIEDGKLELEHLPSDVFFTHLWQNTLEGYLSDPMYGGNRDFVGWKLIGFPGPRYNYVEEIKQHGQPYRQPVVGLLGRDGTRLKDDLWP